MIVIADVHLGKEGDSFPVDGVPSQRADVLTRLRQVGDIARKTKQVVVVAGDVFNKVNPTTSVISEWFGFLSEYQNVRFILIGGNHDAGVNWMNLTMVARASLPNVRVVSWMQNIFVTDSTGASDVLFWPHMTLAQREKVKDEEKLTPSELVTKEWPEAKIIVTHGSVVGADYQNDIFFEAGDAMTLDLNVLKAPLVIAGHFHDHGEYSTAQTELVYPGSLTINNFGEVEETKGYLSVNLDESTWEFSPFDTDDVTPWQHVILDMTEKDETQIDEDLVAEIATGAVVKVTAIVKQYGTLNEAYIRAMFNKYGYVTRFETKVTGEKTEVKEAQRRASHTELLREWMNDSEADAKVKKRAIKMGDEIIEEVLS